MGISPYLGEIFFMYHISKSSDLKYEILELKEAQITKSIVVFNLQIRKPKERV